MKCVNHTEIEAAGVCVSCGKPFCVECIGVKDNRYYCQKHMEEPAPEPEGRFKPGLAAAMNLLPGLGYLYLGLYDRALIAFLLFFAFTRVEGPLMLAVMAFAAVDAHRQARAMNAGGAAAPGPLSAPGQSLRIAGGVLLILLGVLFFLEQAYDIDLEALSELWPLVLIGLGAWMLWSHFRKVREGEKPEDTDQPEH